MTKKYSKVLKGKLSLPEKFKFNMAEKAVPIVRAVASRGGVIFL